MYHHRPEIQPPDWLVIIIETVATISSQLNKKSKFTYECVLKGKESRNNALNKNTTIVNFNNKRGEENEHVGNRNNSENGALLLAVNVMITCMNSQTEILNNILEELKKSDEKDETYGKAWVLASTILDRFFALFFTILVLLVNLLLLYIMPRLA